MLKSIMKLHYDCPAKEDILVFLTGQEEIETCQEQLEERKKKLGSKIKELVIGTYYFNISPPLFHSAF